MENVLVEDCYLRFCPISGTNFGATMKNFVVRRNLVVDHYPLRGHTMGFRNSRGSLLLEKHWKRRCVMRIIIMCVWLAAAFPGLCGQTVSLYPSRGMQEREEVYVFTQKPGVKKIGDKWMISFASKAACDATVAIVGPDGRIARHLASGLLGKNAPPPFEKGTLTQRIEWDGKDDQGKPTPAGCKVRVSLGLNATFDRNIGYDPHHLPLGPGGSQLPEAKEYEDKCLVAAAPDGRTYVLGTPSKGGFQGRVFDARGNYVRTFWPVAAADLPKLEDVGYQFATTIWGDRVPICGWFGPTTFQGNARRMTLEEIGGPMFSTAGIGKYELLGRPEQLPAATLPQGFQDFWESKQLRMAVDRAGNDVYVGHPGMSLTRFHGETGEIDTAWFGDGGLDRVSEVCVGPDGFVYISTGACGYGQFITRLDRSGRPVPFEGDSVPLPQHGRWVGGGDQYGKMEGEPIFGSSVCPAALTQAEKIRSLWTGHFGHSNTHERGLYVAPDGTILAAVLRPHAAWAFQHGVPKNAPQDMRNVGSG